MGKYFDRSEVSLKDEKNIDIHEHEILLAFRNDYQAEAFADWLEEQGYNSFELWMDKHGEDYV